MAEQKLPYLSPSDADFATMRRYGGFYVDKTGLFRDLFKTMQSTLPNPPLLRSHRFLARPRRFGKTLLIDTLEAWFQGLSPGHRLNPEGHTTLLNGMPAGWTSPPWLWDGLDAEDWHGTHGWHPVIRLNLAMATAESSDDTHAYLRRHINAAIRLWQDRSGNTLIGAKAPPDASPGQLLTHLARDLATTYNNQIPVVLVDEYDAPLVNHIGTEQPLEPAVKALQNLFSTLKDDANLLYGVFVTGITRLTLRNLFSPANNFDDISDKPLYGSICGFTEDEVGRCLAPYREVLAEMDPRLSDNGIQSEWRDLYNGYRFSERPAAPRVYNPFTLTWGISNVLEDPDCLSDAAEGNWPSAWSESGNPGLIYRLASDIHRNFPPAGTTGKGGVVHDLGPGDLENPSYNEIMLDTGYYTWHGGDETPAYLNFPNLEVAKSWARDILETGRVKSEQHSLVVSDLVVALANGDVGAFCRRLEKYLCRFSFHNMDSESSFGTLLQSLFLQTGLPTSSEKSSLGGRSDHEIHFGDRVHVFEVKFNQSVDAAREQIRARQYGREHMDSARDVVAVSLNLVRTPDHTGLEYAEDNLAELLAESDNNTDGGGPYWGPG